MRLTNPMGKAAARDIVQFVPFNNFAKAGLDSHLSRLHLAREVLAEVPDQFVSFMKSREDNEAVLIVKKPKDYTLKCTFFAKRLRETHASGQME